LRSTLSDSRQLKIGELLSAGTEFENDLRASAFDLAEEASQSLGYRFAGGAFDNA